MSAFLGPIHSWLYNKIKLQNELTVEIVKRIEVEGMMENLSDCLDRRCGTLEAGELADIIDEDNIHGWLQQRVSLVENRLATAVSMTLEERPDAYEAIVQSANKFGEKHAVDETMNLRETYNYLEATLLNGMPCDHVNSIVSEDETKIVWEQTIDIHKPYWDMVKGEVVNYYDIRNALIEGLLVNSKIAYAKTAENHYELYVKE